ncbi:MAG: SAM-dependent methyltransferase [Verrucomicrobia bacterium]|nr:SAM-dependent methyltransferase [Verrucomicrobiota bacterium]
MRDASPANHQLNYKDFIQFALYDSEFGYYCRAAERVGRSEDTDFYTSQSLGPIFGALVTNAASTLLQEQEAQPIDLKDWTLVEIGYEKDPGWWDKVECPFRDNLRFGPNDELNFTGNCIVFSNELFDAQPFHRIVYLEESWKELGVDVSDKQLSEIILSALSPEVDDFENQLPIHAPEGYIIDLPLATKSLAATILNLNWNGLFIALDYGKPWAQLASDFPYGTARSYFRHKQSPDLIAQPGMQDLTCHICWDWLEESLTSANFQNIAVKSQEAFFVKHAAKSIEQIISANLGQFDENRQSLMHLIHPGSMGQQFQVLSGYRPNESWKL